MVLRKLALRQNVITPAVETSVLLSVSKQHLIDLDVLIARVGNVVKP